MTETWFPVVGFEVSYEVSDHGRIRNSRTGLILKPQPNNKGHFRVYLGRGNPVFIHQAVLEAYVSSRPDGLWGLHKDDDKTNNAVTNLYWGTPSDNAKDAVRNGHNAKSRQVECIAGHEFTPENIVPNGRNGRGCRECGRRRSRDYMRRKAAELRAARDLQLNTEHNNQLKEANR